MPQSLQCLLCLHRDFLSEGCAAFPGGLPTEIVTGAFDHREPFPGDGGVRWEPADAEAARIAAELDADDDE